MSILESPLTVAFCQLNVALGIVYVGLSAARYRNRIVECVQEVFIRRRAESVFKKAAEVTMKTSKADSKLHYSLESIRGWAKLYVEDRSLPQMIDEIHEWAAIKSEPKTADQPRKASKNLNLRDRVLMRIYCYFSSNQDKNWIWFLCISPALILMWVHFICESEWLKAAMLVDGRALSAFVVMLGQLALVANVALGKVLTTKGRKAIYEAIEYIESVAAQQKTAEDIRGVTHPTN